jgi:hypothetical protein
MRPLFFYLGVFLISFSTLMLEIIQTRILSVVVWYHLAFFVLLFSLILTTGIGSFLSEKFTLHNQARITTWAILTGGYLVILPFVLSELFAAFNDSALTVRAAVCVLSITPAGLLLGYSLRAWDLLPPSIPDPRLGSGGLTAPQGYSLPSVQLQLALRCYDNSDCGSIMLFPAHSCFPSFGQTQNFSAAQSSQIVQKAGSLGNV